MKHSRYLLLGLLLLVTAGIALAQVSTPPPEFTLVQRIGQPRPRGIVYDPNFDRFAWVDSQARLLLVDAATLQTQHVLYESGNYSSYLFSHDGRTLALAIDVRVELWDTQRGTLLATFAPDGALSVPGPLIFSEDDRLLLVNALNRAPREIRISENDTLNLSWVWDINAELDIDDSILPGNNIAVNFFDYRYGMILGPNRTLIAAIPERYQVLELGTEETTLVGEIPDPNRFERDPIDVWRSKGSDQLYVRPLSNTNRLVQVFTEERGQLEIPLGGVDSETFSRLQPMFASQLSHLIGQSNSRDDVALLRLLLGENYRASYDHHPLTVALIDIIEPVSVVGERDLSLLVYIYDEQTGRGSIERIIPGDVSDLALHPAGTYLAVRRASGTRALEIYNLTTGGLEQTIMPAVPYYGLLTYDRTGEILISDFQRFDVETGAVLFEDLTYNDGFTQFTWDSGGETLTTVNPDNEFWTWELTGATDYGRVINRRAVEVRGSVIRSSPDNVLYLSQVNDSNREGVEIYNSVTGERRNLYFENLPGQSIQNIVPSPDWQHYLVAYSTDSNSPHYPGLEVMIYGMDEGRMWYVAGDDLPEPPVFDFGWVDNRTVYFAGEGFTGDQVVDRVYGVEWDVTGLPACLVQNFPDQYERWLEVWERLNARLRGDILARFTLRLCGELPDTVEEVDALITRPATATRVILTPAPVIIAGVPNCLTQAFPSQALEFAQDWRDLTDGLPEDEAVRLEELLCEGINRGAYSFSASGGGGDGGGILQRVMTLDIETGMRAEGGYVPPRLGSPFNELNRPVSFEVLEQFRLSTGIALGNAVLSPDGRMMAFLTANNHIEVYRLPEPHDALLATITATYAGLPTEAALFLRLRPTATLGFATLGAPRPTLTATITPTSPPAATATVSLPQIGQVEEFCPAESLYTLESPAPDYAPPGRLFTYNRDYNVPWVLNPRTGEYLPDYTLPPCEIGANCTFSFDENWIYQYASEIILSRPDGSDRQVLFTAEEQPVWPTDLRWLGLNTLEYTYQGYLPQEFNGPVTLVQRLVPNQTPPAPRLPFDNNVEINRLATEVLSRQPGDGPLSVVRTSFPAGDNPPGYKYYIYDRDTGEAAYFARLTGPSAGDFHFEWHPLGDTLYYRYPGSPLWNIFDAETREHRVLGDYPQGQWSRDGRYRVTWFELPLDEQIARLVDDPRTPTPTPRPDLVPAELFPVISIWDRETGGTRRYCLPDSNNTPRQSEFFWSPDNRYLAFITPITSDQIIDVEGVAQPHLLVLDTQTGAITDLGFDVAQIETWMQDFYVEGGQ
ncbi:MAG: WD40 repeat domain-containing protein [bacterium]|nr:WD40 repeat domain-containing protein [bacterium]